MPSLFGSASASSPAVLRSLYPGGGAASFGSPYDASQGFGVEGELYRSIALPPSQAPAPFEPFAQPPHHAHAQHYQPNKFAEHVPMQMPSFSKRMELPPMESEEPQLTQLAKPLLTAAVAPVPAAAEASGCPLLPSYVEPHSHFYCAASAAHLMFDGVLRVLRALHESEGASSAAADCALLCSPLAQRFRVDAAAYPATGRACSFTVRLYACPAKARDAYCVEFSRVDSSECDRRHFFALFHAARGRLQLAFPLAGEAPQQPAAAALPLALPLPSLRCWSAPELPAELFPPVAPVSAAESVQCTVRALLSMAESEHFDVQLQGTLALAEMSSSSAADVAALLCQEACGALVALLQAQRHAALLRPALCALANSARALGEAFPRHVPSTHHHSLASVLQQLQEHEDERCRQHAAQIAERWQTQEAHAAVPSAQSTRLVGAH